ncbi:ubiquitin-related domain-containing protein [Artemisia annua]|uniref:Ubiquitin-related domain-containing protein n=1 Tax=Artemisia annua TaxID=35608 RepID=A0A2U1KR87_ARTAN|nr:ubiquitin-related domain-containing protein [Artemisia annua]
MSFRVRAVKLKQKDSHINLKVVSQMNELDPYFRVRRDEPLKQLMIRWSVRANVGDYRAIRFFFDGMRVNKDKTPNDMELEDGDCLDAFMDQMAG